MAGKSDEGSKDSNLGNREHFDSFDRLQKVDQQNLNVDELKAEDKDSDSEELLATKDKTQKGSHMQTHTRRNSGCPYVLELRIKILDKISFDDLKNHLNFKS